MQSTAEIINKCIDFSENSKIVSLPLEFAYLPVDILAKEFTKLNSPHEHRIHYLGPRYANTQALHKKCAYSELSQLCPGVPDRSINKYRMEVKRIANSFFINERLRTNHFYKTALYYRAFEGMNPTLDLNSELIFNGGFESGNLDCVIKYKPKQFDIFLRIDSNTRGHLQWFYFSISNGNHTDKYRFNICNISKPGTFYQQQMQPYIFSRKNHEHRSQGWQQGSPCVSNVSFNQKPFNYKILADRISMVPYCYSFEYEFVEPNDEVYFAYCIPYTYSELIEDVSKLDPHKARVYTMGRSLTGLDIPLLHITDHKDDNEAKRNIIITGRIHPAQSNSSHVLKGFMDFLCSKQKIAQQMCKTANFFIVPMMNPDGVILGNSRCSTSGQDLNRIFPSSDRQIYPQVCHFKAFVSKLLNFKEVLMYFDFHGHSRKKNTFFYGPAYPIANPNYLKCRILPRIIEKLNCGFRYYSCSFSISESKKSTGRAAMFETFQIPYTYTVQSSISSYYDSQLLKTFPFTSEAYMKMGRSIAEGLSTFVTALNQYDCFLKQRRAERDRRKNLKIGLKRPIMFEDQQVQSKGTTLKIHYKGQQQCLFVKLLQQVKSLPQTTQTQKNEEQADYKLDQQASSDDHDEKQDFQVGKLKQFSNLIIQNARKDNLLTKLAEDDPNYNNNNNNTNRKSFVRSDYIDVNHRKLNSSYLGNQDEAQEMQLFLQLQSRSKIKSSHGGRSLKIGEERSSTRVDIKRNFSVTKQAQIGSLSQKQKFNSEFEGMSRNLGLEIQMPTNRPFYRQKRDIKIRSTTVSRSSVGKQQYRKWKLQNERSGNHFSDMQFPNEDKNDKKLLKHHKTDIFRKNLQKKRERDNKAMLQCSSSNQSQLSVIKHPNKQLHTFNSIRSKKMTQFKIDDLMNNLENRSKMLYDSVKFKDSQHRFKGNAMFPSSFYCMRQQINSKKRAGFSRERSQSYEQPLSITVKHFDR